MPYVAHNLWPRGKDLPGLTYLISQLPSNRVRWSKTHITLEDLKHQEGLHAWFSGQNQGLLYVERPPGQQCTIDAMALLAQSQKDSPKHYSRMFTFDFGWNNAAGLQNVLASFVVQGLSFLFLDTAESQRPETVLKILRESNPTSDLSTLFELVNLWFHRNRIRPLWVLWDSHQFTGDMKAIVGEFASCCKFSEISLSLLFAGEASGSATAAMRQFNIRTLAVSRITSSEPESEPEPEAAPNTQDLLEDNPGLVASEGDIKRVLEAFSPYPTMCQVVKQIIRKIAPLGTMGLNLVMYQPDRPDHIFKNVLESIPEVRRTYMARLLQWLVRSFHPMTVSEAATALCLESLVATDSKIPWKTFRETGYPKSRKDLELAKEDLCGIIRLEAAAVDFTLSIPVIRQVLSEDGHWWYLGNDVQSHMQLLRRLIHFLELEIDLTIDASAPSLNTSQFRLYAAQYWADHYKVVSQSDTTQQLAEDLVIRLLQNPKIGLFLLQSIDGLIGREDFQTAASVKVALLTRHRFDIGSIEALTQCAAWDTDQNLLFAGFLGAVAGSFNAFVERFSVSKLKDPSKIEKVMHHASVIASPEFMEALFDNIAPETGIKIPASFLKKAFELRLNKVIESVFAEPEWLQKLDLDMLFTQCVVTGYTDFASRLVASKEFEIMASDKKLLLNEVLDAAGHNRSSNIVSLVLSFRKGNNLDIWKELEAACSLGAHEAVSEILIKNPDDFTTEAWTGHRSALIIAVSRGFERCTEVILESMAVADLEVQEILRAALLAGVEETQSQTCQQLLQSCPELLDESTTVEALRNAAEQSNLKLLQVLFASGPPIDADLGGYSVLHIAAVKGDLSTLQYLLSKGAVVNACNVQDGATPLIYTCSHGHTDAARLLLEYDAEPGLSMTADDYKDWSALEFAIKSPEIMKMLVDHSSKPDFKRLVEYKEGHATAMYLATDWNLPESVRLLLRGDVDLEFEREAGVSYQQCYTALTCAVSSGYSEIVRLLLERGANINHVENAQNYHTMARVNDEKTLIALLEYNPDLTGLSQGLNSVIESGQSIGHSIDLVTRILNAGADPNALDTRDSLRYSPLMNACASRRSPSSLKLVKLLIGRGAMIEGISDSRGGSPLHVASDVQAIDVVECLLDAGADVNFHVGILGTPLEMCCTSARDHEAKIQMLVDRGADINAMGSPYYSIFTAACLQSSFSSISYLIEHGAQVNQADKVGCLPVLAACLREDDRQHLIESLMSSGATLDVTDNLGRTILHYAAFGGDLRLVQWLLASDPSLISKRDFDGWSAVHWALMTPIPWTSESDEASIDSADLTRREDDRVAIIRLLVDSDCPGTDETVQIDDEEKWNCMRIAKYFGAPAAVQAVILELSQSDDTDSSKYRSGLHLEGWSCDGCYSVSEQEFPTFQTHVLATDKRE